jgi:predicted DNA-binding protein (UPF0251 family)/DNA-directed RNA polymerase subunit RPC12/RpoP
MTKRVKRRISCLPNAVYFKPRGIPVRDLEVVELTLNELEAARLVDLEGLEQEEAAHRMGISRRTFWIDLKNARYKIIDALVNGKAIEIKGGSFVLDESRTFECESCLHRWQSPFGTGRPLKCPKCGSTAFYRVREVSRRRDEDE